MRRLTQRVTAAVVGAAVALGGAVLTAAPASASAASTAFSNCMNGYLTGQKAAYALNKSYSGDLGLAILYTGYSRCYYDLSQRTDISDQTEIDAVNNFNSYYSKASTYITKAGVAIYKAHLAKYSLRGLVPR